jgi:hypothetical protein
LSILSTLYTRKPVRAKRPHSILVVEKGVLDALNFSFPYRTFRAEAKKSRPEKREKLIWVRFAKTPLQLGQIWPRRRKNLASSA